jgi:hypothetical protein
MKYIALEEIKEKDAVCIVSGCELLKFPKDTKFVFKSTTPEIVIMGKLREYLHSKPQG